MNERVRQAYQYVYLAGAFGAWWYDAPGLALILLMGSWAAYHENDQRDIVPVTPDALYRLIRARTERIYGYVLGTEIAVMVLGPIVWFLWTREWVNLCLESQPPPLPWEKWGCIDHVFDSMRFAVLAAVITVAVFAVHACCAYIATRKQR